MRISDWSSDVCSSDLSADLHTTQAAMPMATKISDQATGKTMLGGVQSGLRRPAYQVSSAGSVIAAPRRPAARLMITKTSSMIGLVKRSEEHTSELQSLMRNSYAVFCLKKKKTK